QRPPGHPPARRTPCLQRSMSLSRRSRLALLITEVYCILMSHGSLTERGAVHPCRSTHLIGPRRPGCTEVSSDHYGSRTLLLLPENDALVLLVKRLRRARVGACKYSESTLATSSGNSTSLSTAC